jgi:hypothetical protein
MTRDIRKGIVVGITLAVVLLAGFIYRSVHGNGGNGTPQYYTNGQTFFAQGYPQTSNTIYSSELGGQSAYATCRQLLSPMNDPQIDTAGTGPGYNWPTTADHDAWRVVARPALSRGKS